MIPSRRMSDEGFACIAHYSSPFEICPTWTKDLRRGALAQW
ncbi:hypothetical protein BS78_08G043800 [Paspalum vaginatum]|nr:hypothetical protein BS78_08G043800 [Paspalum vaginatum]